MNTSDMHPFIHLLSAAVDPAWESKSDWEIYKGIAKKFSEVCVGHLGKETDVVTPADPARLRRGNGAAAGCQRLEKRRMRSHSGENRAAYYSG
ncbi:hypothetical protein ACPA9J_23975 [Pseudomonas aeruginosa]